MGTPRHSRLQARALVAAALLVGLVAGCVGSADVTIQAQLHPSDALTLRISAEGQGPLMEGLIETLRDESGEVYSRFSVDRQGDVLYLVAESTVEDYPLQDEGLAGISVEADKGPFWSDYRMTWRTGLPDVGFGALEEPVGSLVASVVTVRMGITLPGRITGANADHVEGDTATWYVSVLDVGGGQELTATSRLVHRDRIIAAGALIGLIVLGGLSYALVAARRRTQDGPPAD